MLEAESCAVSLGLAGEGEPVCELATEETDMRLFRLSDSELFSGEEEVGAAAPTSLLDLIEAASPATPECPDEPFSPRYVCRVASRAAGVEMTCHTRITPSCPALAR